MSKMRMLGELWEFMRYNKKWWLTPIILFLLLLSAMIVFTEGAALSPFIYTLF